MRKSTRYQIAEYVWHVVAAGIGMLVFVVLGARQAEFDGSSSQLSPFTIVAAAFFVSIVLWLIGRSVIRRHKIRSWHAVGRQANLTPEDSEGRRRELSLSGTIDGRTVRVRVPASGWYQPSPRGNTTVEVDLNRPVERGFIVGPVDRSGWQKGTKIIGRLDSERAVARDKQLVVYGHSEPLARAVVSGRSRRALLALEGFEVYIGNASTAASAGTKMSETRLWSLFEDHWTRVVPDDPSKVSIETSGPVLEADRLKRQVQACVAVADAFEEARSKST